MSEVLIVLTLRRRSGVLAAAVAAVHRAGLEFQSQRMVDADGATQLHLQAEGELDAVAPVVEIMGAVSGVDEVVDILADGISLMHPVVEPAPDASIEPVDELETGQVADDPWSELEFEEQPSSDETSPPAWAETTFQIEPEPEPESDFDTRLPGQREPDSAPAQAAESVQKQPAAIVSPEPSNEEPDGEDKAAEASSTAVPTPAMVRRRRRRR